MSYSIGPRQPVLAKLESEKASRVYVQVLRQRGNSGVSLLMIRLGHGDFAYCIVGVTRALVMLTCHGRRNIFRVGPTKTEE